MDERRRYIRTDKSLPLIIYLKEGKLVKEAHTTTRNISATGVMVECDKKLPVGTEAKLDINTPGSANPVHGIGRIVWSSPLSGGDRYRTGIEFVRIEEDNKNTFLKYLCDAIYKSSTKE